MEMNFYYLVHGCDFARSACKYTSIVGILSQSDLWNKP